jgi:transposase
MPDRTDHSTFDLNTIRRFGRVWFWTYCTGCGWRSWPLSLTPSKAGAKAQRHQEIRRDMARSDWMFGGD